MSSPRHRMEPPCFSCGKSKFEPAPEGCLDKKNHITGEKIQLTNKDVFGEHMT